MSKVTRECKKCGKKFAWFPSLKEKVYCSRSCWVTSKYKVVICKRCGGKFAAKKLSDRVLCSMHCSKDNQPKIDPRLDLVQQEHVHTPSLWQRIKSIFIRG